MNIDEFNRRNGREWMINAACAKRPDVNFFPEQSGGAYYPAKEVCKTCVVKAECLEYALKYVEKYGVWGGVGARARVKMRQQRREQAQ